MNDFLKDIENLETSEYKDEESNFPNLHKIDKTDGSFKELLNTCKKVREDEIQGFLKNTNKIRENKVGQQSIGHLHEDLSNQQLLDDDEDFI